MKFINIFKKSAQVKSEAVLPLKVKKFLRFRAFFAQRGYLIKKVLCLLAAAVLLFFGLPKIYFDYNTSFTLPSGISDGDRQQYLERWQQIRQSQNPGKNNSLIYNDIGILRSGLKDYPGAVRAFKLAARLNPDDQRFFRNLGIAYNYLGDYVSAEEAFLEAFRIAPTSPDMWLELGELYTFKMKDENKAKLFYLEALRRSNGNLDVVRAYASFLEEIQRDYNEAIRYWQILADADTPNKTAYMGKVLELKARVGAK